MEKEITERQKLEKQIADNHLRIKAIKDENRELVIKTLLLSDEEQWFTEKEEICKEREGRKVNKITKMIGRVHWNEYFTDEDTNEKILLKRNQVVRVNGKWL